MESSVADVDVSSMFESRMNGGRGHGALLDGSRHNPLSTLTLEVLKGETIALPIDGWN